MTGMRLVPLVRYLADGCLRFLERLRTEHGSKGACAYPPEVSNWACSAEFAKDKAAYGTLLYSNLIVMFLPHYRLFCSVSLIKL